MKRSIFSVFVTALMIMGGRAQAGNGRILTHSRVVPDSYIVILNSTDDVESVSRAIARQYHVKFAKRPTDDADSIFRYAFQGFSGSMTREAATALAADPRVSIVEENAFLHVSTTDFFLETEPMFNLDRIDQLGAVMANQRSYTYQTTGAGVYIYVFDSGVQRNHVEFDNDGDPNTPQPSPRVKDGVVFADDGWPAYNPCNGYVDTSGPDLGYKTGTHGTAVASVAAGKNVGVAKAAYIVPVRIITCTGDSQLQWWCWGMDWVAGPNNPYPKHPAVLNASVWIDSASPWDTTTPISSFQSTINNVIAAGVTVVASANNQGNSNCTTTPALMGYGNSAYFVSPYHVITVGGTDEYDRPWRCANFGDCNGTSEPGTNTGRCVDLYAPAHNLKVAWNTGYENYRQLASQRSGTSFAAPLVAGIAARLLQTSPNMTPQQVWDAVRQRAVPPTAPVFDDDTISDNNRIAHIEPYE